jgi:hypothetical protein
VRVTRFVLSFHLSRQLANTAYSIQMDGSVIVEGSRAVQVIFKNETSVVDKAQSEQRWDFDESSGLPLRIEYRLASTVNALDSIAGAVELSSGSAKNYSGDSGAGANTLGNEGLDLNCSQGWNI